MHDTVNHFKIQSNISIEEMSDSRPPRPSGAPSRTRSHYSRILALLIERGPAGVTSAELYDAPHLFGRSPRNRISELRQDGHLIKTVQVSASTVRYILTAANPAPPAPKPKPARKPGETGTLFDVTRDAF